MPAILPLGNDIVDLGLADNLRSAANRRYVERVLAPEERIAQPATIDNRVFWAYWAAKESAYKALKKIDSGLVFAHRCFVVHPETAVALAGDQSSAQGVVLHETKRVPVTWVWTKDWVHCVTGRQSDRPLYRIEALSHCRQSNLFIAMKNGSTLADESLAARSLALSLLAECGIHDAQIIRDVSEDRQLPPRVVRPVPGTPEIDISLSHDGRYAAAAIRVP